MCACGYDKSFSHTKPLILNCDNDKVRPPNALICSNLFHLHYNIPSRQQISINTRSQMSTVCLYVSTIQD